MNFKGLTISVPKEIMPGEKRVAVTPETVKQFKEAGARILFEKGAGEGSFLADSLYQEAGAEIIQDVRALYNEADIVLKVKEPQYNEELQRHEAELCPENSVLVTFLHPANKVNHEMVRMLARRNIIAFTLDGIPRISRAQQMDTLTAMSTVAGYKAGIFAAYNLGCFIPMMPTSSGVIHPAQFLIIGAGVAGLQAIATAKRLGAKVKVLDIRPDANEQARSLGAEIIPFDLPSELAVGEGGYARRLSDEWHAKEKEVLSPHVQESDAVILTALIPGEVAPVLVDEQMIRGMKKGSVIIDIAIDQGGNCELSRSGEEYNFEGIFISALKNVPATLPIDSTRMFARNILNYMKYIVEDGKIKDDPNDEIISGTLVTKAGQIVHKGALLAMDKATN
ncbi:MAG: NAD(P) transhydrogenase subunit alpha [Dethiobacteria bacterium]